MKNQRFNPFQRSTSPAPKPAPKPAANPAPAPVPQSRPPAQPTKPKGKGTPRRGRRKKRTLADAQAALDRIRNNQSTANFPATIAAFVAKGIPADQIDPKENVLTFDAWPALGRHVRRGEKGVTISAWRIITSKDETDDKGQPKVVGRRPTRSTLFHISQTEANKPATTEIATPDDDDDSIPSWL